MANLMQDMASGSSAVLTMQQNMAAAPDVQQAQKNVMQEQALKIQQEQANVDKARLSNLMADAGWQSEKESSAKMVSWVQANPKATPIEQLKAAAGFKMEVGATVEGAKIDEQITAMEAKTIASEIKKSAQDHEEINNARSVLNAVRNDPAKLESFAKDLPPTQLAAIKAQVGPKWDQMTSTEQLDALEGLMHNAQRQLVQKTIDAGIKKNTDNNTTKEKIAKGHDTALVRAREVSASGRGAKGTNQLTQASKFATAWGTLNKDYEEKIAPKREALANATDTFTKATKYFGLQSLDITNKDDQATSAGKAVLTAQKAVSNMEHERFSRGYDLAMLMEAGPAREMQLKLMGEGMLRNLDGEEDKAKIADARKKANPNLKLGVPSTNEADGKGVPSNKPSKNEAPSIAIDYLKKNATPEIKKAFKDKYGYLPDGV